MIFCNCTFVPGIINIRSNLDYIPSFFLGEHLIDNYLKYPKAEINTTFQVINDFYPISTLDQKFDFCYGNNQADTVYYERPLGGKLKLKLLVENLQGTPRISVNKSYYRFVKTKMESLYPPGIHLTDITAIKLLEKDFAPVHSACLSLNNDGILLFAPPNMGKSLTTFLALKSGYNYLSEDITVVDRNCAYSCPQTTTFLPFVEERSVKLSLFKLLRSRFNVLSYLVFPYLIKEPHVDISKLSENFKSSEKANIRYICILERGEEGIEEIDKERALRNISILNRNEFYYPMNPVLLAYSYFNQNFNLDKLMEKEKEILSAIIDKSECYILKVKEPKEYVTLLRSVTANR
jgi:hypothetical protein